MISAVFDCVVYVQAALSRHGPAFTCVQLAEAEHVTLFLSPEIIDEIKRTLAKPRLRTRFPSITDEHIAAFLDRLEKISYIQPNPPGLFALQRDPKDEPFLNLAIVTSASFLVTRDLDLLDLMQDQSFRTAHPRLTILDPVSFLQYVRVQVAKELGYGED
jgi:putative PIN family toxin of toxin-antitoxin system